MCARARTYDAFVRGLRALEACGDALAAEVEDEAEVDGDVEVEPQHVGLDGRAEAHGGVQLHEPVQQRAARLVHRHAGLGLDQVQHIGAHAELQRVRRAVAVPPARAVIATAATATTTTSADGAISATTAAAASDGSDSNPTAASTNRAYPTAADRAVPSTAAARSTAIIASPAATATALTRPAAAATMMPAAAMVPAAAVAIVARAVRAGVGRR